MESVSQDSEHSAVNDPGSLACDIFPGPDQPELYCQVLDIYTWCALNRTTTFWIRTRVTWVTQTPTCRNQRQRARYGVTAANSTYRHQDGVSVPLLVQPWDLEVAPKQHALGQGSHFLEGLRGRQQLALARRSLRPAG